MKIALPPSPHNRRSSDGKASNHHAAGQSPSQSSLFDNPSHPPSSEFHVVGFEIDYDHRERAGGWRFCGLHGGASEKYLPLLVPTKEIHMQTADYTAVDSESGDAIPCYIERKSHDDCINSIGGGHKNLRAEHERMREIIAAGGYCCVIVESSLSAICDELESPLNDRRLTSAGVMGVVSSWPQAYGVDWTFAGDRRRAEELAFAVLKKAWERSREEAKAGATK